MSKSVRPFLFFLLFLFFSCCESENKEGFEVPIQIKNNTKGIGFSNAHQKFPFRYLHEDYPLYYEYLVKKYRGLPEKDYYIVVAFTDSAKFTYDLFKNGFITEEKFKYFSKRLRIDVESEEKKSNFYSLFSVTGIENNRQYLIVDTNGDYDFGDEEKVFFDALSAADVLENTYDFKFEFVFDQSAEFYKRKITIVPSPDYYHFQRVKDTSAKKLGITGTFLDYWGGHFSLGKHSYSVALQGFHSKFLNIYIKEDIQSFSTKDEFYNQNFVYQLKDTIKLDGRYYRIDSLKNDFSGLFIKRLHMVKDFSDGFRIGDVMQTYPLKNLSGANFEIPRKGSSDYLLLDFWGTWCPPCREMLPDIKNLKHKFSDRLEVVGIALDKSPEVVQNYCSKNDIDWKQTYLNIEEPNHFILKNLSIKVYPTLILLDKNNKIVYRGSDISGIKEIEKIISQ